MKVIKLVLFTIAAGILVIVYSIKSAKMRVFVMFLFFATIATAILIFVHTLRPVTDLKSAAVQADKLIAAVGGPAKVCDEARQIIKRFPVPEEDGWRGLTYAELSDYPAIAALGRAGEDGLNGLSIESSDSGFPPLIRVRVGTHLDGYTIDIVDTSSPIKYRSKYAMELVDSCIFVAR